jgi:hypothetical protein
VTRRSGKKSRPVAVSGILGKIFQGQPLEKRLREGKIWQVWDSAVGDQIAAKARPANFRDGVLTVMVSNAPWMQQLNFLKKGIIEKINAALGEEQVREIFLKAGRPETLPPEIRTPKKPSRPLTSAENERIARETADIDDSELREAFANLLAKHLSYKEEE